MPDRIPCCIPFCRRTRRPGPFREWICGKHWPLVPARLRRLHALAVRRWRRYGGDRLAAIEIRVWRWCRAAAIERAGGFR